MLLPYDMYQALQGMQAVEDFSLYLHFSEQGFATFTGDWL